MKNKRILVFFIEGLESYTEVNFFDGIKKYGFNIFSFGMHKAVNPSPIERNRSRLENILDKHWQGEDGNPIECFFFADGDVDEGSIDAIRITFQTISTSIREESGSIKINNLVILEGKKFEEEINYWFKNKKHHYKRGFDEFCAKKGFNPTFDGGWKPVFDFFKKTAYKELFVELEKQESYKN